MRHYRRRRGESREQHENRILGMWLLIITVAGGGWLWQQIGPHVDLWTCFLWSVILFSVAGLVFLFWPRAARRP